MSNNDWYHEQARQQAIAAEQAARQAEYERAMAELARQRTIEAAQRQAAQQANQPNRLW